LSKEYLQSSHKQASQHWIPLLALYTGARLNELCQLEAIDIKCDDDKIWYIDINDNNGKSVKTGNAKRLIPLHRQLITLGFIDFANPQKKHGRLFKGPSNSEISSDGFSKWFNRTYMNERHCDVGNHTNESKCFHSFRHTFINQLTQNGVDMHVIEALAGHSSSGSESRVRYSKELNLKLKYSAIEKLKFDGVTFNHIKKWKDILKRQRSRNT
jgi:integrase